MYFEKNTNGLILNSLGKPNAVNVFGMDGKVIHLNKYEQMVADNLQYQLKQNALGADVDVTTMTTIIKETSKQKFFEISLTEFLAVRAGEGSMGQQLTAFKEFQMGGKFSEGFINQGANTKLTSANVSVEPVHNRIYNWAKELSWNLLELGQASFAGDWELVSSLERSRKKNWDLGIQEIFFLGDSSTGIKGLLNMAGVTINTTLIKKKISFMTGAELKMFVTQVLDVYRTNAERTTWPDYFEMPESDYLGLAAPSDDNFHIKSKMEVLLETFRTMTKNPNFNILPLAYADAAYNELGKTRYTLGVLDPTSARFDIPTDYTSTIANTVNGFQFQNVAYGQVAGAMLLREREFLYFDLTP